MPTAQPAMEKPMVLDFLGDIRISRIRCELAVERSVTVGAYPGTSLRGALGYVFRDCLCASRPVCGAACARKSECLFQSFFASGAAAPFAISPPLPDEFTLVSETGQGCKPFRMLPPARPGWPPRILSRAEMQLPPGTRTSFLWTVFGDCAPVVHTVTNFVRDRRLAWGGGLCRFEKIVDMSGPGCDWPPASTGSDRFRVVLRTPVCYQGKAGLALNVEEFAEAFWERCLVRAIKIHDFFRGERERLPRMRIEDPPQLVSHRLLHCIIPNYSYQQQREKEYEGLIGWLEFSGGSKKFWPLLKACEVLQIGERTTSGFGCFTVHECGLTGAV